MSIKIEFSKHIQWPVEIKEQFESILMQMFPEYQRLVVVKEFSGDSFSGSWVFQVHLIGNRARPGRNLPVVVKIASVSLIEKEWRAYEEYIRGRWPKTTGVESAPVWSADSTLGGLYYFLAGDGIFSVQNLHGYALQPETTVAHVEEVLNRFAKAVVEGVYLFSDFCLQFNLRASYDAILPINMWIKPLASINQPNLEGTPVYVAPDALPEGSLSLDTHIRLEGFVVTKVDLKQQTITLNLPNPSDLPPDDAYHVRLMYNSTEEMPAYKIGQEIPATEGIVFQTRYSQWQDEVENLNLEQDFTLDSPTLSLSNTVDLPNPFMALPGILNRHVNVKVNYIHGDLNLGNIVVDSDVRDVSLIDFAEARWDHVMHDFLRFETEVLTKLVTPALVEAGLPASTLYTFYEQLHWATFDSNDEFDAKPPHPALEKSFAMLRIIRGIVRDYALFKRHEYAEYYDCLTVYLLGALKFSNLNPDSDLPRPWPKEVAFWGAAAIQKLRQEPPARPKPQLVKRATSQLIARSMFLIPVAVAILWVSMSALATWTPETNAVAATHNVGNVTNTVISSQTAISSQTTISSQSDTFIQPVEEDLFLLEAAPFPASYQSSAVGSLKNNDLATSDSCTYNIVVLGDSVQPLQLQELLQNSDLILLEDSKRKNSDVDLLQPYPMLEQIQAEMTTTRENTTPSNEWLEQAELTYSVIVD